jgi:predicted phage terminase large subunit-like protein
MTENSKNLSNLQLQVEWLKREGLKSLYFFNKKILGYEEMAENTHMEFCQVVENEKLRKKLILMPRGSFKSTCCTVGYTLQSLVKNPDVRILISSETYTQSETYLSEIKRHIESNNRFRTVFGNLKNDNNWTQKDITVATRKSIKGKEPSVSVSGVGQTRVGMHYDKIFLDDVVSQYNVNTPEQIKKTIDHYKLLLSILEPEGELIVIGTRYAYEDLYGYIIENEASNFKVFIRQACNSKIDESSLFFPERLTKKFLIEQKKSMGSYLFSAQYLNNPMDDDSAMFRKSWIQYYTSCPANVKKFMSIDPAASLSTTADYTAIVVCGIDENSNIYVLDAVRARVTVKDMIALVFEKVKEHSIHDEGAVALEVTAFQQTLKYAFQEEMNKRKFYFQVAELTSNTRKSKERRVAALQPYFENGKVWLKKDQVDLIDELLRYPRTRHDDLCFSGDTLITTLYGLKKISDIKINDYVWTRQGFKKVLYKSCRLSKCNEYNINGYYLKCTPNHNVITTSGKKRIDALTNMDFIYIDESWKTQSCLMGKDILDIQKVKEDHIEYISSVDKESGKINQHICTEICGNSIMVKYLKDLLYTIKMATLLIIPSKILKLFQKINIFQNILKKEILINKEEQWKLQDNMLQNGMEVSKEKNFIGGLEKNHGKIKLSLSQCAIIVEKKSQDILKEKDSAMIVVDQNSEEEKVYNLTVEDCHEYLANGILVANCDALASILRIMFPAEPTKVDNDVNPMLSLNEKMIWQDVKNIGRKVKRTKYLL